MLRLIAFFALALFLAQFLGHLPVVGPLFAHTGIFGVWITALGLSYLATRYGDVAAVLEEAARPPFALVAFACSGLLAFRYVTEHADRVSHLILIGGQYAESMPQPVSRTLRRI